MTVIVMQMGFNEGQEEPNPIQILSLWPMLENCHVIAFIFGIEKFQVWDHKTPFPTRKFGRLAC